MKLRDLFFVVLITGIWGLNYVFVKMGLSLFPPIFFCALRFMVSSLAIVFLRFDIRIKLGTLVQLGLVLGVLEFSLLYLGMKAGVATGIASLLMQAQIIFTILLSALLLRDKSSWIEIIGILIACVGVFGIAQSQENVGMTGAGIALILCAAFAGGLANIILKRAGGVDMFQLIAWMSIVPPIPLLLISYTFEDHQLESLRSITAQGAFSLFYIGIISTLIGFGLWGRLLKRYCPSTVAPFTLLVPVFGILTSFLFLDERLTLFQLLAAAVVLIGLSVTMLGNRFRLKTSVLQLITQRAALRV